MIVATRAIVTFSNGYTVDGYKMPDGELRAGLEGSSLLVGYAETWLSLVFRRDGKTLKGLRELGYTGVHLEARVASNNLRGSSLVKTISLDDLNAVIDYAAFEGKKKARALSKALRKHTLTDFFRKYLGLPDLSWEEKFAAMEIALQANREDVVEIEEAIEFATRGAFEFDEAVRQQKFSLYLEDLHVRFPEMMN